LTAQAGHQIRTTKGIHVTCPPVNERAIVLFSPIDGRLFFNIPWMGYSWIGTTDTDFTDDPGNARATFDDVDYLISSAREYFPSIDHEQVIFSNAGVRALVMEEGSESSLSRMHRIENGAESGTPGLISVLGGKLTGYRAVAEEVTDIVARQVGNKNRCQTAELALPGARPIDTKSAEEGIDAETTDHLTRLYGTRAIEVLQLAGRNERLFERLAPSYPDIAAQVIFAVRSEQCVRVADFVWRRSLLGFSPDQGAGAWAHIAELMAQELGWLSAWKLAEIVNCRQFAERTQQFRKEAPSIRRLRSSCMITNQLTMWTNFVPKATDRLVGAACRS
jgi:glycerol-3-phosphate dehydrogenase